MSANVNYFDFDLWARLIAGMGVVDGHTVLKQDFLSYTPTHVWYDHEYGSGVVFYFLLKHFGAYSLILFQSLLIFGIFFFIVRTIKVRGIKNPYNFLFYLFPIVALTQNFGSPIRCHLFSFLFFTVYIYILELSRRDKPKILYILPLLTIVWNNLHGGVVAGLGLIAMYALGDLLNKKNVKHYIYAGVLSALVLIINPWGFDYIKFLLMANTMKRPDVVEWFGIFHKIQMFKQIPFKIFMLMILSLELGIVIKHLKLGWKNFYDSFCQCGKIKLIVLVVTLFLSVQHVKMLPFFVITAAVFCYEDFVRYVERVLPVWTVRLTLILMLLVGSFGLLFKNYDLPLGIAQYPHREVEFIKINNLKGNVLVNFGLGSFVAYKLYPNNKIYMDGRYEEVYYDDMVPLLKKFYLVNEGWDEVLIKYPPDIIILEKYYPIYDRLNGEQEWENIYDTENFAVYVRSGQKKTEYIQPSDNQSYYKNTLFDTSIKF